MFENLTIARVVTGAALLVGCLFLNYKYELTFPALDSMDR
jgi:hypothetical protein